MLPDDGSGEESESTDNVELQGVGEGNTRPDAPQGGPGKQTKIKDEEEKEKEKKKERKEKRKRKNDNREDSPKTSAPNVKFGNLKSVNSCTSDIGSDASLSTNEATEEQYLAACAVAAISDLRSMSAVMASNKYKPQLFVKTEESEESRSSNINMQFVSSSLEVQQAWKNERDSKNLGEIGISVSEYHLFPYSWAKILLLAYLITYTFVCSLAFIFLV